MAGVSPIVETPAGAGVAPPTTVAGAQAGVTAGAQAGPQTPAGLQAAVQGQEQVPALAGLPSTSTAPVASIPSALALVAFGAGLLLRRRID